jgi:uncharacterized RDD family membrane protein YckC
MFRLAHHEPNSGRPEFGGATGRRERLNISKGPLLHAAAGQVQLTISEIARTAPVPQTVAADSPIGGFWRRFAAQVIDAIVWGVVATSFAVVLVYLAPNVFGLSKAVPEFAYCEQLESIPSDVRVPGLTPNQAWYCSKSFFGIPFRNEVKLVESHAVGNFASHRAISYPVVDRSLRIKQTFDLDLLVWIGFVAYLVIAQALGRTVGKRLMRLRVVDPDGRPPGWGAALIRNLVLSGPWLLFAAVMIAASAIGLANVSLVVWMGSAAALLTIAIAVQIAFTASRGRPSIHDRLAGTRVILLPR